MHIIYIKKFLVKFLLRPHSQRAEVIRSSSLLGEGSLVDLLAQFLELVGDARDLQEKRLVVLHEQALVAGQVLHMGQLLSSVVPDVSQQLDQLRLPADHLLVLLDQLADTREQLGAPRGGRLVLLGQLADGAAQIAKAAAARTARSSRRGLHLHLHLRGPHEV